MVVVVVVEVKVPVVLVVVVVIVVVVVAIVSARVGGVKCRSLWVCVQVCSRCYPCVSTGVERLRCGGEYRC